MTSQAGKYGPNIKMRLLTANVLTALKPAALCLALPLAMFANQQVSSAQTSCMLQTAICDTSACRLSILYVKFDIFRESYVYYLV